MRRPFIIPILLFIISVFSQGCSNHKRLQDFNKIQDVPSDSIDVYAHLKPNDEWNSGRHTYGEDSIIGNTIKYRLATDSIRIGVDIDITILELHPRITANLLSFAHREFLENGFVNESDTIAPFRIKEKSDSGFTQSEIVHMVLDWEGERFYHELPQILEYEASGFNLAIEIYPVFLNENYVTYRKFAYYYTGGAHGNYTSFLQTYNRQTGESVDLDDIIIPEKLDKVRERVAYHMAEKYPLCHTANNIKAYLDSLNRWKGLTDFLVVYGFKNEDEIEQITLKNFPINDPGIHSAGLVFTYEKYHLTPGCDGCPVVLIPYDEIKDCLKEPFNHYHFNLDECDKYQTTDIYDDTAFYYTETQLDSVRAAWSPADDGKPWPRDILDWYKYRGREIGTHYKLDDIIGTWIGYGHLYDSRQILTIYPNGRFSNISEEALKEDSHGRMIYNYTNTLQGMYSYDSKKNHLMFKNWNDIILNDNNLEAYVKQRDPENKHLIIHSIEKDTMYVADEIGDLWPFFRKR